MYVRNICKHNFMTTCGVTNDDKVGIMATLGFRDMMGYDVKQIYIFIAITQ